MNDRYLYRAKRKNWRELPKEMWWVEGYYAYFKGRDNHCIYYETDELTLVCDIDISTLCACTGLKDKNGKLIWENDIVRDEHGNFYKAFWQNNYYQFSLVCVKTDVFSIGAKWDLWSIKSFEIEVIGNIFDNPELLLEGKSLASEIIKTCF